MAFGEREGPAKKNPQAIPGPDPRNARESLRGDLAKLMMTGGTPMTIFGNLHVCMGKR